MSTGVPQSVFRAQEVKHTFANLIMSKNFSNQKFLEARIYISVDISAEIPLESSKESSKDFSEFL